MTRVVSAATPSGPPPVLPVLLALTAVGLVAAARNGKRSDAHGTGAPPIYRRREPLPAALVSPPFATRAQSVSPPMQGSVQSRTGRRLNRSAALLAFAVLADSAIEHYRGSFQNRAMYTPLVTATLTLGASLFGSADTRERGHPVRDAVYVLAAATGFGGVGFHAYNISKRPGGVSWLNLFYSAPIGAPIALVLAGLVGRGAEKVRDAELGCRATVFGLPAGRMLAALSSVGLFGTALEAALLHFRGAYHNPAMLLPVSVPPAAAALLGAAACHGGDGELATRLRRLAGSGLAMTALLGLAGVGFHAFGVSRNMGGWRNWSQNVLNGPPLPAPPSFTALALAGFAALALMGEEAHG